MAVISKGLELWMKSAAVPLEYTELDKATGETSVVMTKATYGSDTYYLVNGLQEIGELNGIAGGAEREKIEVTTLKDDRHVYVDGIIADSDTEAIEFKLLYDAPLFKKIKDSIGAALLSGVKEKFVLSSNREDGEKSGTVYKVEDFTAFATWSGSVTGIKVDSVAVNSAITMTLTVTPDGAITMA